jgi:hypothetical protein
MVGDLMTAFEHFKKWLDTNLFVLTLVGFALLAVRFVFEFVRSYKLLRRFHRNEMSGGFFAVLGALASTYVRSIEPLEVKSWIAWGLYDEVRRRAEYEAIYPRHEAPSQKRWRAGLKAALRRKGPLIRAHTSKDVASAEDRIRRYFEVANRPLGFFDLFVWLLVFGVLGAAAFLAPKGGLPEEVKNALFFAAWVFLGFMTALAVVTVATLAKSISAAGRKRDQNHVGDHEKEGPEVTAFTLKLEIEDAFIAPLHLIAGLLNRVDDEWREILNVYKKDMSDEQKKQTGAPWRLALKAIRPIQKFTFDCWLLWGPSIPICDETCSRHQGSMSSIQLGYGDENSSIEVIGNHETIGRTVGALAQKRDGSELAVNVATRGWLSHSHVYRDDAGVSAAIRKSWEADENGRVLLLLEHDGGKGSIDPKSDPSFYYTAYLWVCFVMMRDKGGEFLPISSSDDARDISSSREPWLDFMPFFEHGNIAESATYEFLKRQLALKAMGGLARLVEEWEAAHPGVAYPLKFAYACAIDDSGCGSDVKFSREDDIGDIKAEMAALLAGAYAKLKDIVLLDHYAADATNPHASCTMPDAIREFYDHVALVNAPEQAAPRPKRRAAAD